MLEHCQPTTIVNEKLPNEGAQPLKTSAAGSSSREIKGDTHAQPLHQQAASPLFGRESQEKQLLEAYRRQTTKVTGHGNIKEITLITGASGTGKTVLAKSLERRVKAERGYFCGGKCDQMQQNEPFAPFRSAVKELLITVLQQDDSGEETARLEECIEEATKDTESALPLLTNLFPIFQKVVIKEMGDLSHSRSQTNNNNSNYGQEQGREHRSTHVHSITETPALIIFAKFLRSFCCAEHPVVMLLDDWQWLDSSSLELLKTLCSLDDIPGLMILGTCRGNEVSVMDPLSVVLRTLEEQEVVITDIQLTSLSVDVVQEMITNLLKLPSSESVMMRSLAEVITKTTNGNPFYVQQNLIALCDANIIYYTNGSWHWDEHAMGVHDDFEVARNRILDAALQKLANLSQAMHETLVTAAFLGACFSLQHLQAITNSDHPSIQSALATLVQQGVLEGVADGKFRWTHDRFQHSAHSLLPANQQGAYSVAMGRKLLVSLEPAEVEEHPFLLANLFLRDLSFLKNDQERLDVAHLLFIAGTTAATSSAFEVAASFFADGIELLQNGREPQYAWRREYDLCLALHNGAVEMECCSGHHERSDEIFEIILRHARGLEDQLRAYEAKLHSLSARHMDSEGVIVAFEVLRRLGEPFPKRAVLLHTGAALAKTVLWIRRRSTESIVKSRPMRRWDKIAAVRILQIMIPAVVRANPEYAALCACRSVQLTIRHGLPHRMSAPIFLALGMILGTTVVSLTKDAQRCVDIGYKLDSMDPSSEWHCRLVGFEHGYINWWHHPFGSSMQPLITAMNAGLLSGDVHVGYILSCFYSVYGFCCGVPLREHTAEMEKQYTIFSRLDQKMLFVGLPAELGRILSGDNAGACEARKFSSYCNSATDGDEMKWGRKDKALLSVSVSCQLLLAVYTNDWVEGLRIWEKARKLPYDEMYAVVLVTQLHFLFGMVEVLAACETRKKKAWAGWRSLRKLRALKRAMTCPENIVNKIFLIEAERAALQGYNEKAKRKFLASVRYARESNFIHEEALAYERLARALSSWGDIAEAEGYKKEAAILYHRWGFAAKVVQLTKVSISQ